MAKAETVKMDVRVPCSINGVSIEAGKGVEVPAELVDAVKDIQNDVKASKKFIENHNQGDEE